jgi:sugar lactone lactonase YvrE
VNQRGPAALDRRGDVHLVADGFAAPNAIAVDRRGNLYVSDSFDGTVTRVRPDGSGRVTWASDPLFTTTGFPPFGANGLAFDAGERHLYVANTGDSSVLRIPVRHDGSAGAMEVFARGADLDSRTGGSRSLHGADGIQFDVEGNLWVCANQANEIQVLSPAGEIVARYRGSGASALDFPASLVFRGRALYLTNLSLFTAGGVNSKLSAMRAPVAGAPLVP